MLFCTKYSAGSSRSELYCVQVNLHGRLLDLKPSPLPLALSVASRCMKHECHCSCGEINPVTRWSMAFLILPEQSQKQSARAGSCNQWSSTVVWEGWLGRVGEDLSCILQEIVSVTDCLGDVVGFIGCINAFFKAAIQVQALKKHI